MIVANYSFDACLNNYIYAILSFIIQINKNVYQQKYETFYLLATQEQNLGSFQRALWFKPSRQNIPRFQRIRDFRGLNPKCFDGRGNYSMGVTEQIIFPEINIDKVNKITGMDITFVTSANTDAEALELLKAIGLPFKNQR